MRHIKRTGIYRMISPTNKVYIGQSRDITNRKSRYKTLTCKNQIKLHNSLLKHGFNNHNFTVMLTLPNDISQNVLNSYEEFVMLQYLASGHILLNLKEAGSFGKHPIESRLKNSNSHKGQIAWNKGTKGICKAWDKGKSYSFKTYMFRKNGEIIVIGDLKKYCKDNHISYEAMINLHNAKHIYKNRKYKEYERV